MRITEFDLGDPDQIPDAVLLPKLRELQSTDPVYWSDAVNGWVITSYEDVAAAFKDRRILNNRVPAFAFRAIVRNDWPVLIPNLWRGVENWVVNMDGPRHTRVRSLLLKAFTTKLVSSLAPRIEELSIEMTDKAARLGSFDFMAEIAYPVPARLIMELVGLSEKNLDKLSDLHAQISPTVQTRASRETLLDGEAAMAAFNEMVLEEVAERRREPRQDFLTTLISTSDQEGRLNDEELLSVCQVLLFAGQDTTVNSLCLGLKAFVDNPDQRDKFLDGSVDPMAAMTEVTRFTAMSTSMFKLAGQDFMIRDKKIRKGDFIFIMIAAANHDPSVFPHPDEMDLARPNLAKVLSFAPGIHLCVGHHLARLEMSIFFKHFLARFPRIELLDDPIEFQSNMAFRGLKRLNVRIATRQP